MITQEVLGSFPDVKKSKSKKSILVIDDCQDFLDLYKAILESEGYEVLTASSGKGGLNLLTKIANPSLILLDVRMGDMSGPEFLEVLEKQRPEVIETVPVVFLTAMDKVPKSKAIGFIQKPIDLEKLLATIKHYIELEVGHTQH